MNASELRISQRDSDEAYFLDAYTSVLKDILSGDPVNALDENIQYYGSLEPSIDIKRAIERAKQRSVKGIENLSYTIRDIRKDQYVYEKLLLLKKKVSK